MKIELRVIKEDDQVDINQRYCSQELESVMAERLFNAAVAFLRLTVAMILQPAARDEYRPWGGPRQGGF